MEYRPELDGIRAFGMIAVLAFHANVKMTISAWLAVDAFFVLSGYLITTIVLNEWNRKGEVSMRNFYIRRLARLYPALFAVLVLGVLFYKDLGARPTLGGYAETAAAAGLYVQDFVWGIGGVEHGRMGHAWSLAVEMQFYLVWPIVLLLLLRRRQKLLPWIFGLAAISFGLLALQSQEINTHAFASGYYLPWTRATELLMGCAVAVILLNKPAPDPEAKPKGRWVGWLILFGFFITMLLATAFPLATLPGGFDGDPMNMVWQTPLAIGLSVALMFHLHQVRTRGIGRILSAKPVVWLGVRSYGFYLFHYPLIWVLKAHFPDINLFGFKYNVSVDGLNMFFTAGAITLVFAALSWKFFEEPAQRWGRRYIARAKERAAAKAGEPPAAATGAA